MRITSKGKVTIPIALREKTGLRPNTEVEFEVQSGAVLIRPGGRKTEADGGARLVEHMRGRGDSTMSTDEIMALFRGR